MLLDKCTVLVQDPNTSSRLSSHLKVAICFIFQNLSLALIACDCGGNWKWAATAFLLWGKEETGVAAVFGRGVGGGGNPGRDYPSERRRQVQGKERPKGCCKG